MVQYLPQHFGLGIPGIWIAIIVTIIVQTILLTRIYPSSIRKRIAL
jgi:Na+-driven multidrug efflux pump